MIHDQSGMMRIRTQLMLTLFGVVVGAMLFRNPTDVQGAIAEQAVGTLQMIQSTLWQSAADMGAEGVPQVDVVSPAGAAGARLWPKFLSVDYWLSSAQEAEAPSPFDPPQAAAAATSVAQYAATSPEAALAATAVAMAGQADSPQAAMAATAMAMAAQGSATDPVAAATMVAMAAQVMPEAGAIAGLVIPTGAEGVHPASQEIVNIVQQVATQQAMAQGNAQSAEQVMAIVAAQQAAAQQMAAQQVPAQQGGTVPNVGNHNPLVNVPLPQATPTSAVQVLDPVMPTLENVVDNGDGTFTAYFGYESSNTVSVYVPVGPENMFVPEPVDRGQPTTFHPGGTDKHAQSVFTVTFKGGTLKWMLMGETVTALVLK